jgi:hypothetical protein
MSSVNRSILTALWNSGIHDISELASRIVVEQWQIPLGTNIYASPLSIYQELCSMELLRDDDLSILQGLTQ